MLIHVQHREAGGEDVVVAAEVELMRAAGHDIEVCQMTNPEGAAALSAFAKAPWNRSAARPIVERMRSFAPDVVHVHNTWFALSLSIVNALRSCQVPIVMTLHNYRAMCIDGTLLRDGQVCTACVGSHATNGIVHGCYRESRSASAVAALSLEVAARREVWSNVDVFIAPTEQLRAQHIAHGFDPEAILVKPHFVADPGVRALRPSGATNYVFAGRLAPGKGVVSLLRAWQRADLGGDYRLHLIGDGPLRAQVASEATSSVDVVGRRDIAETRRAIGSARAFLFPSQWLEPFGVVLIEALSAGTPVLGYATADTAAIVGAGGRTVPAGDEAAFAQLIRTTYGDDLDALGVGARQTYEREFTPQTNLPQLLRVYASAIERNARR